MLKKIKRTAQVDRQKRKDTLVQTAESDVDYTSNLSISKSYNLEQQEKSR